MGLKATTYGRGPDLCVVLAGMANSGAVLGVLAARWPTGGMFGSTYADVIGGWCVDHWRRYGKPPGATLWAIFETWANTHTDPAEVGLVRDTLTNVGRVQPMAPDYILDRAGEIVQHVAATALANKITAAAEAGRLEEVTTLASGWAVPTLGAGKFTALDDPTGMAAAFGERQEDIVTLPGAAGEFFRGQLVRDAFIAFMGPEKRGKTFWLLELAMRAIMERRRVAYYCCGDLSMGQLLRRLTTYANGGPLGPVGTRYPTELVREENTAVPSLWKDAPGLPAYPTPDVAAGIVRGWCGRFGVTPDYLRAFVRPAGTQTVDAMRAELYAMATAGWVPDVVITDYADIMAPAAGERDFRHQTNGIWQGLRRVSQEFHCLLATATQTDAKGAEVDRITRSNFSEDKRKLAHVNGMVGINQNPNEKDNGVMRLNWLVLREAAYNPGRVVYTGGQLAIGRVLTASIW